MSGSVGVPDLSAMHPEPGVLVARWLGPACEPGRQWFARLWAAARPAVAGRAAHTPRIWNT